MFQADIRQVNGAIIYFTPNVVEALKIAEYFKTTDMYHYFRGQASLMWPVKSSLARRGTAFIESEERIKELAMLATIFSKHPATKYIFEGIGPDSVPDIFYAIAQHYGIPTDFIDFTTSPKVAAFFAVHDRPKAVQDEQCQIICINKDRFQERINLTNKFYRKKLRPIGFLEFDVSNLWRLQAQEGLFLYLPILITPDQKEHYFEDFCFPFDRIVFPAKGDEFVCPVEDIYPVRKSQLESVLDQFFDNRKRSVFFNDLAKKGEKIVSWTLTDDAKKLFRDEPVVHHSWNDCDRNGWERVSNESWTDLKKISIDLHLDFSEKFWDLKNTIYESFKNQETFRCYIAAFEVKTYNVNASKFERGFQLEKHIQHNLQRIWDGMRQLPYSLEEISQALSSYLNIVYEEHRFNQMAYSDRPVSFWDNIYESPYLVDVGANDTSYCKAMVDEDRLINAFRPDFPDIVKSEYKTVFLSKNIIEIFLITQMPCYLYDFDKFKILFIDQIIPGQIYYNGDRVQYPIFFSPTQIQNLGPH